MQNNSTLDIAKSGTNKQLQQSIGLSSTQQQDIIAFLKTLTDSTFLHDRRFVDPSTQ